MIIVHLWVHKSEEVSTRCSLFIFSFSILEVAQGTYSQDYLFQKAINREQIQKQTWKA